MPSSRRRNRSSSLNSIELSLTSTNTNRKQNNVTSSTSASTPSSSSSSSKKQNEKNMNYMNDIIMTKLFHSKEKLGRTPLHLSVLSQSLGISSALLEISSNIDTFVKSNNKNNTNTTMSSNHVRKLLLTKNEESGYTGLHLSILSRNLRQILLLLQYAIMDESEEVSNSNITSTSTTNNSSTLNNNLPIHLLEGERSNDAIWENLIWNELVQHTVDKDNLTPIQLLGKIVCTDLCKCRNYILDYVSCHYHSARRRGTKRASTMRRRRLYSFEDSVRRRSRSNSFGVRSRSNSFVSNNEISDYDDDEDEEEDEFYYYYSSDDDNNNINESQMLQDDNNNNNETRLINNNNNNYTTSKYAIQYGCEVLTYGSADHCALGIPHISSSLYEKKKNYDSVRPAARRVEHFAISEMENCENSAIAVAAGAYHTLTLTKFGELYAFGLGKSGRLGTGDEQARPLPTRILGSLTNKKVTSIAASTNHSLCSTSQGHVYAWGSNRFGQLGIRMNSNNNQHQSSSQQSSSYTTDQRCLPRRVDDLLKTTATSSSSSIFVIRVAASDKHSVALTIRGEVYAWGSNQYGQLGLGGACSSAAHPPTRVESLWCSNAKERQFIASSISASELSTLVLCRPVVKQQYASDTTRVNSVYAFGHMNSYPMKVNFPDSSSSSSKKMNINHSRLINPVGIACAKHHSAVITSDGHVYTWGFHADPLGLDDITTSSSNNNKKSTFHHALPVPQLVSGMLPQNGGGFAVAVAASCDHTAVLTDEGNLYTWGSSKRHKILGYEGVKYQPLPRKVPGIYRAVDLAVAKEHTVLLIGTSKPKVGNDFVFRNNNQLPSMQTLAARKIANHVDMFNVIPISLIAERMHSPLLLDYCKKFIQLNLDGVLAYSRKKHLNLYLQDGLKDHNLLRYDITSGRSMCEDDGRINPLLLAFLETVMITRGTQQEQKIDWPKLCASFAKERQLVPSHSPSGRVRCSSIDNTKKILSPLSTYLGFEKRQETDKGTTSKSHSDWCKSIIRPPMDLSRPMLVKEKHESLSIAVRSTKKKLARVLQLEEKTKDQTSILSEEQHLKLARRPVLEADLVTLMDAMQLVEQRMIHFNLFAEKYKNTQSDENQITTPPANKAKPVIHAGKDKKFIIAQGCMAAPIAKKVDQGLNTADILEDSNNTTDEKPIVYKCIACNLSCPDEKSYELHINGRRHRNRLRRLEEEEKNAAALKMMENKLNSSMSAMSVNQKPMSKNTWTKESSCTPKGKTSVSSFQEILKEEEAKKVTTKSAIFCTPVAKKRSSTAAMQDPQIKTPPALSSLNFLSVPNSQKPVAKLTTIGIITPPQKAKARSKSTTTLLNDSINTPPSWGKVTPTSSSSDLKNKKSGKLSSSSKPSTKSLLEIQQEEINFHDKSKISDGRWYLSEPQPQDRKKDRSESLGAIQQEQERMSRVIEEQLAIEAEIYNQIQRERELQKQEQKKEHKQCKDKKKNRKDTRRHRHGNRKSPSVKGSAKDASS